ncbi:MULTISPECIES: ABC transporter permease [Thermus]|jgi:thiamine transport system permease protein|uniref:ABC transporter permease n=1 Tax=Thermus brockianus TaxID=56956 RepID=A0A1J0LSW3_THEBO|nr:ABC transporter permease subunit [Thermus brockianus]APD08803.1 ABC transporter permease [Thermus brockianus]
MARLAGGLVLLFLGFALFYPLFRILLLGLGEGFWSAWTNPYYWERYRFSLGYGLTSALLTLTLALPLAFLFRRRFPLRAFYLSLSTLPFVLPTPVVALGFLALLGPRGVLGVDLYGTFALLLLAAVFYNLGLALRVLLPVALGLEGPLAAARTLGATPFRAFLRVGLPLLLPALGGAGLLVFLYTFSAFGVPLLLGGPRYATLEVEVYTLLAHRLAFPEAAALMAWQLFTLAMAVFLYLRLRAYPLPPGPLLPTASWAYPVGLGVFFLLLYAPLFALFLRASPQAFLSAWTSEDFTPLSLALANTLRFSLLTLLLALPLGVAYGVAARRSGLLDLLGLLPLMVSPVAVGLGYLVAYPGLRGSFALLLTAYALLAYPLLARALLPALKSLPPSLLEAARTLGATPFRALLRVELPLLRPALASGVALALAAILGEFGASLVLWRPEWTTLTLAIYERLGRPGEGPFREALALAAFLALLSGLLFYLLDRGRGRVG